jgi:hypothetical protein
MFVYSRGIGQVISRVPNRIGGTILKVRLKVDLTKYHPDLVAGVEGDTVGAIGLWCRGSDRFVGVRFPSTTLDILWDSGNYRRAISV